MAILGLLSTESVSAERFTNVRRKVFYFYPNGAAPLTGLLSMLKEEDTDDPEFGWYEKRLSTQATTTANITNNFLSTDPANTAAGAVADAALVDRIAAVVTINTIGRMKVTTTGILRVGHIIKIKDVALSSGTTELVGIVTFIGAVAGSIDVRWVSATTSLNISATQTNNLEVLVVGSSFAQGVTDISRDIYNIPTNLGNYTQIFRAPFSLTGTAAKTSVKYDETGPYKDKAKEASIDHMREMEKSFIFGKKSKITAEQVSGLPSYTTGGILWFMEQWELGTVYGNSLTAITADTDDQKRIIVNSDGKMNDKRYCGYLERVFRVTNNTANEKLVLCGSGFLSVINQMYKSQSVLNTSLPFKDTFGMNVVKHETPFGTVYYKSHPLFSLNPTLRFNALFLDVNNLHYRYVQGRDTALLKNRQANDADFRKDEWLSECGLEVQYPESNMYLQNVTDYTP